MFKESDQIEKFEPKVWLSSPTMHGEEFEFLKEAYETNWMSTVGANINEVERLVCKKIGCNAFSSRRTANTMLQTLCITAPIATILGFCPDFNS